MALEANNKTQPPRPTHKDFIFLELIGEGSFSMVFKARRVADGHICAIKICEKRCIRREKKIDAIHREKLVMKELDKERNPYFIRLFSTFHDDERLYFVMTYAKNGELLKFIRRGVDVTCARFYAGEILMALEFLHNKGIIHR